MYDNEMTKHPVHENPMSAALNRRKAKLEVLISVGKGDHEGDLSHAEAPVHTDKDLMDKTSDLAPPSKDKTMLKNDGDSVSDMADVAEEKMESPQERASEGETQEQAEHGVAPTEISMEEAMKGMPILQDSEYVRIKAKPKTSLGEKAALKAHEMMKAQGSK